LLCPLAGAIASPSNHPAPISEIHTQTNLPVPVPQFPKPCALKIACHEKKFHRSPHARTCVPPPPHGLAGDCSHEPISIKRGNPQTLFYARLPNSNLVYRFGKEARSLRPIDDYRQPTRRAGITSSVHSRLLTRSRGLFDVACPSDGSSASLNIPAFGPSSSPCGYSSTSQAQPVCSLSPHHLLHASYDIIITNHQNSIPYSTRRLSS
jgi:hypothetical protein